MNLGKKKSNRSAGTETAAKERVEILQHKYSTLETECQMRGLRQAMKDQSITPRDIVQEVKPVYPGFDKTLLSKCMNADKYGVTMTSGCFSSLAKAFPELVAETKKQARRGDNHKLTDRVSCRLEKSEYEALQRWIHEDGFDTMQAWLVYMIRGYLKQKEEQNGKPV